MAFQKNLSLYLTDSQIIKLIKINFALLIILIFAFIKKKGCT